MNKITRTHSLLALLCALGLPACSTAIITASGTDTETTGEASDAGDPTTTGVSTATSGNSNTAGSATAEPTSTDGGTAATTGFETGADTTDSVTDSGTSGTDSTATDTDTTDTDATDTDATGTDTDTGPDPVICAELDAEACALEPACMTIDGALIDLENKCKQPPAFIECQDAASCAEVISYACPDGSDEVHEFPNACLPAGFVPCDPVELEQICD